MLFLDFELGCSGNFSGFGSYVMGLWFYIYSRYYLDTVMLLGGSLTWIDGGLAGVVGGNKIFGYVIFNYKTIKVQN